MGKSLKFTSGKILFAQLNKGNLATNCLCDLPKQSALARFLVTGKLGAIGDVVELQLYGFVFAISGTRSPLCFGSEPR